MSTPGRRTSSSLTRRLMYPTTSNACQMRGCVKTLGRQGGSVRNAVAQKCKHCMGVFCSNHCGMRPVFHRGYVRLCDTCYSLMKNPALSPGVSKTSLITPEPDWRDLVVEEVTDVIKQKVKSAEPDQYYILAVKAVANDAAAAAQKRIDANAATASATIDSPSSELFQAMSLQMLRQFLEYFNKEEKTQVERMTTWYDHKMKRLQKKIDEIENGGRSMIQDPGDIGLVVSRRTNSASAGRNPNRLSTPIHLSVTPSPTVSNEDDDNFDINLDSIEDGFADADAEDPRAGFVEDISPKEQLYKNVDLLLDGQMSRTAFDESVTEMINLYMVQMSTLRSPDHHWTTVRDYEEDNMV